MNEIERNRRKTLQAIIALGLTGPGILIQAEASPIPWVLRTGAKFALHGVLVGFHVGAELVAEIREMHEEWHAGNAYSEGSLVQDNWERYASYYLTLHIPPGRDAIDDMLQVNLINLQSGTSDYIASVSLYAAPSTACTLVRFPVPPLQQQGLFRFEAVFPSLNGAVTIQSSNPVLVQ